MALIHIFNGITKKETFNFNGRIGDHITGIDWAHSVIMRAGVRINEDYEAKPDDLIIIRRVPNAPVAVPVIIAAVLVGGYVAGKYIYEGKKALAEMKAAQEASKAGAETSGKLPYIKGARNSAATGRSFPYAMGKSLMTPYRLCPAHYTIGGTNGAEQYYNAVLEIAYNDIVIEKIKMGETVIKDFSNATTPQNGQYSFDAGVYYDERNLIEIRQTGAFTCNDFNKKIILTELNTEIPHEHASGDASDRERIEKEWKAGVVQELATNAKAVEIIALFDGLQRYNDGWQNQTITLKPQWTNKNNPQESDWVDFNNGFNQNGTYSNTFTYNTKKQMRFIARQEFTADNSFNKTMKVRVIRTTPKAASNAKDSVYILGVQTYCYDAKKSNSLNLVDAEVLEPNERDKCCRIGVRIAANNNTEGTLDTISVIETACARTWNGTEWSTTKQPTRNLAAWVLELLTSPHHKTSKYDDNELDLDSFGEWFKYCADNGFYADGIITKSAKKKQTIDTLCANSNAVLYKNIMTGLIEVAVDNGRDYSVALLNSENIISISTAKEFKRKTTGKKVTYINAAAGYDADSVIFMRDGSKNYNPATDTLTETALEYVTDYEQAYKIAWRQMAEELAQPRVITLKTGREAAYYPFYSRVELQHKALKLGIAHSIIKSLTWKGGLLKEIYLSEPVEFPATGACGVIINCVSDTAHGTAALKVNGTGKTDKLEVLTSLSSGADNKPAAGNILSFGKLDSDGEFTTITRSMKITNAEESDDGYILTLVDYNPDLYTYGTLPAYKSNITSAPNGKAQTIESQRTYATDADISAAVSGVAQAAVDTVSKGGTFTNIYSIKNPEYTLEDLIRKIDEDASSASASISISEGEILMQVEDTARELTGLIDIQAGAVTALVEGGGATGQMALSLNLPVIIDSATRGKLINASSADKVNAVYGLIENTSNYGIKGNAGTNEIKALWNDAIAAGLIASQIDLTATQIKINGDNIYINGSTMFTGEVGAEKIKAALIDANSIFANEVIFRNNVKSQNNPASSYDSTTQGLFMDNWGNAAFTGNTIISGNAKFSGVLDCGSLQVTRGSLETILFQCAAFNNYKKDLVCYSHFARLWDNSTPTTKTVTMTVKDFYSAAAAKVFVSDTEITTFKAVFTWEKGVKKTYNLYGLKTNGEYILIYQYYTSGENIDLWTEQMYYNYVAKDYQPEKIVLKMVNLPTAAPTESGIVWNDNGTLKVS